MSKQRSSAAAQNTLTRNAWQITDNAFSLYRNSLNWMEMLSASASTISTRMNNLQNDAANNKPPDLIELSRMVTEKNSAFLVSGQAMLEWQKTIMNAWCSAPTVWGALGSAHSAPSAISNQLRWSEIMLSGFAKTLKPYHSTTTANAKRLNKK